MLQNNYDAAYKRHTSLIVNIWCLLCNYTAAQLDNIEDTLGMINYEMHRAEEELENLEKCCGLCVLPWDRYASQSFSHGGGSFGAPAFPRQICALPGCATMV